MIVTLDSLDECGGALAASVGNANCSWTTRTGLRLELRGDDGLRGLGEASPLPGYSPDSLADARRALEEFGRLASFELNPTGDWHSQVDEAVLSIPAQVPSARFALETALLDLAGQALGVPMERLLGVARGRVPWAGVLEASRGAEALGRATSLLDLGVGTLKVKVNGKGEWEHVVRFLQALRAQVGPAVHIRIDANRSIGANQLGDKLAGLASIQPEFVEEPAEPDAIAALGSVPVALALDETLHGADAEARIATLAGAPALSSAAARYGFVVLKPTVLGGVRRCARLAESARRRGARVIVSHTFEGPTGWTACAALALAMGEGQAAVGLEPHEALKAWPAVDLPNLDGPWIVAQHGAGLGLRNAGAP